MGIFLLSEWEVLAFVYRHTINLTSVDPIARLIGDEGTFVGATLDRLERENLIARSRPSLSACFYRRLARKDAGRRRRPPSGTHQAVGEPAGRKILPKL